MPVPSLDPEAVVAADAHAVIAGVSEGGISFDPDGEVRTIDSDPWNARRIGALKLKSPGLVTMSKSIGSFQFHTLL